MAGIGCGPRLQGQKETDASAICRKGYLYVSGAFAGTVFGYGVIVPDAL